MHPLPPDNPYENLYRAHCPLPLSSRLQAENVARHLGLMHNALGNILKDLVCLLALRFPQDEPQPMQEERPTQEEQPRQTSPGEHNTDLHLFRERLSRIVQDVKKTKKKKDRRREGHTSESPLRQPQESNSQIQPARELEDVRQQQYH